MKSPVLQVVALLVAAAFGWVLGVVYTETRTAEQRTMYWIAIVVSVVAMLVFASTPAER